MARNSYTSKNIQILHGLEPVRMRPGMYIGSTSSKGLHHLVYELVDNAVDESLAGFCSEIYVSLNEDGSVTVLDNGRGVPIDVHEEVGIPAERVIYTQLHAGGKFNDKTYKISGGLHGVGSSVVNALSKKMIVNIYRDGYCHSDSYEFGEPTTKLEKGHLPKTKLKEKKTGTEVTIYPDDTIFETVKFKPSILRQRLKETAYLNPLLTLIFHNKRDKEEPEVFHEESGLEGFVRDISSDNELLTPIISIEGEKNGVLTKISFVITDSEDETIFGYANTIPTTEGGVHISGFKTGFAKLINDYARKELGLLKDKDSNLSGSDIRTGLQAVISIYAPNLQFEGQTKTKLGNSEIGKAVEDIVKEQCTLYFDRNFEVLSKIVDNAILLSKRREQAKTKVNVGKFSFEGNGKLARQELSNSDTVKTEIFLVEGDSAGGTAKTARDRRIQAILPLRGKILNVEKAPIEKVLENAEVKSIINALKVGFKGYGSEFNIDNLAYDKIIIMADADVDGSHIATLLLTFFFRFYPELIEEGHIYIAMPPLYRVGEGKNMQYLYSDEELNKYRTKHSNKNFPIQRYKGLGEMDADQLFETTMNPDTRLLKRVLINSLAEAKSITSVLMGVEVEPRKNYIELHGAKARIDI